MTSQPDHLFIERRTAHKTTRKLQVLRVGLTCLFSLNVLLEAGSAQSVNIIDATRSASNTSKFILQERRDPVRLTSGDSIDQELSAAQIHRYEVRLVAGQFIQVTVEVSGRDVVLEMSGPDGKTIVEVDNPNDSEATEQISWIAETSGLHVLSVRPFRASAPPGHYRLRINELETASDRDKKKVDAERQLTEAELLRSQRTTESRKKAISLYEQSAALYREVMDPANEARALHRAGSMYQLLGQADKAAGVLERAVVLRRALKDNRGIARALYDLGTVHDDLKGSDKALEKLNEALPFHREANDKAGEATTLDYMGGVYLSQLKNEKAVAHYEQAAAIRNKLSDSRAEAESLENLALAYLSTGESQKALDRLGRVLEIATDANDEMGQAKALYGLGLVHGSLGANELALARLEQALTLVRKRPDAESLSGLLVVLALTHARLGNSKQAHDYHQEAQPLIKSLNNPQAEMGSLFILGMIYLTEDKSKSAIDVLVKAWKLADETGQQRTKAWTASLIGLAHYQLNDYDQALTWLMPAVPALQAIQDRSSEAQALAILATIDRDRGNLSSAQARIEAAVKNVESLRSRVIVPELRISFFAEAAAYFEINIDVLMRLHRQRPLAGFDEKAFNVSERARARSLLELLTESQLNIREGVDPALLERERSLGRQLSFLLHSQSRLLRGPYSAPNAEAAAAEIERLEEEYRQIKTKIRQSSRRYADLEPEPLNLKQVQAQLDPDTLLLQYAIGYQSSYVWLVSQTELKSYSLPGRKDIETAAGAFFQSLAMDIETQNEELSQSGRRLSQMVLGPIAEHLGKKRLVIVTNGALQRVPFAALPDPAPDASGSKVNQPLIVQHEILSMPSISVLATLRKEMSGRTPAPRELILFADPVFSAEDDRVKRIRVNVDSNRRNTSEANNDRFRKNEIVNQKRVVPGGPWDRLKGSRVEAEKITALFSVEKTKKMLDFDASKDGVTRERLGDYRHILFATHAALNESRPDLSAIVLSLVDIGGNSQDGFLRLHEIYNLKLNAELVVLSACETGLGQQKESEGLIGLTRGFMYAGAERLVVSLWPVKDNSTAEMMTTFYRAMMKEGKRPAAALRMAQVQMWQSHKWHAAHYWAPFVLQGEWR